MDHKERITLTGLLFCAYQEWGWWMDNVSRLPWQLRQAGHAFIWFLPNPVAEYFCDSWSVSYDWTVAIRFSVCLTWIILTILTEMMELAEGREDRRKYYLDKTVKVGAAIVGFLVAGFWREWM